MTITGQDRNGRSGNEVEAGASAQDLFAALESKGLLSDAGQAEELARGLGFIDSSANPGQPSDANAGPESSGFSPTPITPNATVVLEKRYLRKNTDFEIVEDPEGMFRRVATTLAEADRQHGATDEEVEAATEKFEAQQTGVVASMEKAIVEFDSIKGDLVIQAEQYLLDFAVRIATRLTYAIGRLDRESAKANLGRSLRLVDSKTNLVVHVHPDDVSAMEAFAVTVLQKAEGSRSLKIVADAATAPGGCRVEYGGFEIDATLDTQIEEIVTLLTGRPQNE
ncbi:MAG: hypothetical protein IH868_09575 [Chloroflexi bacterium]|nr:hypothetical protein [Chloroflexota bacterium]